MKLDRRGFIKLLVGGAAGIHLTPLPWKTIDDVAIWTQNWPWVPRLTRYPNFSYASTVCNLCEGGCGVKVRLVNEKKSIKVEGLDNAPVNRGGVCPMGAAGPQYQYNLARFQTPLKRMGPRGSGMFQKISWEDGIGEVGEKIAELRGRGEANTVALITGRPNDLTLQLAKRFMTALGSPNLITMPGLGVSSSLAEKAQFGREQCTGYDLENAKYILSFGAGLIEGWGSPVRSIRAYSDLRAGGEAKLVQVDVQATLTASKADEWLAVSPGTEGALALAMACVIIREGLYNKDFVNNHAYGFSEFEALVKKDYTPEKVEGITGVGKDVITRVAKEFAGTKPAVAIGGKGRGSMPTPVYELMAIQALNALVGNINQKGGLIVRKDLPLSPWPDAVMDSSATEGLKAPRLDRAGTEKYPLTTSLLENFIDSVDNGRFYPISVLIVDRANPDFFGADPGTFRRALNKIPLVVSLSSLSDDTSAHADLVLPQSSNFEGPSDIMNPPTLPYPLFGTSGPVFAESPFDTRPAAEIYLALAEAIGGSVKESMPFESHEDMVIQSAAGLMESGNGVVVDIESEDGPTAFGEAVDAASFDSADDFMEALSAGLFWYDPNFEFGNLENAFQTPSKKFEFLSQTLKEALSKYLTERGEEKALAELGITTGADQAFLPHFETVVPTDMSRQYPLLLVPTEQFKLVTSSMGNAPYLTKLVEDTTLFKNDLVVHINPETADALHLQEGARAWLTTRKGRLSVLVHRFEGARPDVIFAPIGLGHTGFGYYLKGKGANPMEIVEATIDPLSGQALWWGTRANLIKV